MRSSVQETLLEAFAGVLRPMVALLLKSGISCSEFLEIGKQVFVDVATAEFGLRGRPTNVSRVAAMTGLTRKDVRRIRANQPTGRWTPVMEQSPLNVVIHYWHFDPEFSSAQGCPNVLPFEGPGSFSELTRRYVGDIPPGALRAELKRSGILEERDGLLAVQQRYSNPTQFDDDFVRRLAFSMRSLAETIEWNADLLRKHGEIPRDLGRFERVAWTERLANQDALALKAWARRKSTKFIEEVDNWIGEHEMPNEEWGTSAPRTVGVGVYYFEEAE